MTHATGKLGFIATWSMAVGGMVGGGIFSTLGVVIGIAGPLAWLSFLSAGLIAFGAGYSYVKLAAHYSEGGGAFIYLRKVKAHRSAGTLAWVLIVGYTLTNAVYAFTFGQYLAHVLGLGPWSARAASLGIIALFTWLNLRGVGEAGFVEIVLVVFKMVVLSALAIWGLSRLDVPALSRGVPDAGIAAALFGASSVFMAYEGFQLLVYDYNDIANPRKTLPRAVLLAIVVVIAVYIVVAIGTAMLIGADQVVKHKEVALAIAGKAALGTTGLVIVTVAAAFSTGSAINSTLFATARLAHTVALHGELPAALDHRNSAGIPDRAVIGLGVPAAVLAATGSLAGLVESASLAFLITFSVVAVLAFLVSAGHRLITGLAAAGGAVATVALTIELVTTDPLALGLFAVMVLIAAFGRPLLLRHTRTHQPASAE